MDLYIKVHVYTSLFPPDMTIDITHLSEACERGHFQYPVPVFWQVFTCGGERTLPPLCSNIDVPGLEEEFKHLQSVIDMGSSDRKNFLKEMVLRLHLMVKVTLKA